MSTAAQQPTVKAVKAFAVAKPDAYASYVQVRFIGRAGSDDVFALGTADANVLVSRIQRAVALATGEVPLHLRVAASVAAIVGDLEKVADAIDDPDAGETLEGVLQYLRRMLGEDDSSLGNEVSITAH